MLDTLEMIGILLLLALWILLLFWAVDDGRTNGGDGANGANGASGTDGGGDFL